MFRLHNDYDLAARDPFVPTEDMDLLNRPRALRTLMGIAATEPATMRDFLKASGYFWEAGNTLRDDLEKAGLIRVDSRVQGRATHKQIRLTDEARAIVARCQDIDMLAQAAQRRARDDKNRPS